MSELENNRKALKGRNNLASREFGMSGATTKTAPRSAANYGDGVAWGEIDRSKLEGSGSFQSQSQLAVACSKRPVTLFSLSSQLTARSSKLLARVPMTIDLLTND